jgi:hypothetical protein
MLPHPRKGLRKVTKKRAFAINLIKIIRKGTAEERKKQFI